MYTLKDISGVGIPNELMNNYGLKQNLHDRVLPI